MRSEWQESTLTVYLDTALAISEALHAQIEREFSPGHSIMRPLPFSGQVTQLSFVFHDGKATPRSTTVTTESYRTHVAMVVRRVLVNLGLS